MQHLFRRFSKAALSASARLDRPKLAARLLYASVRPIDVAVPNAPQNPARRALILNSGKDEFFQDIEETFSHDPGIELVAWPSHALRSIADALLSPTLDHDDYVSDDPTVEESKRRYRDFLKRVWAHYQTLSPTDVVIGANFGYCVQRELAGALEACGTPFIVLQKENRNASSPTRRAMWQDIYEKHRGPFSGRKILVCNGIERDLQLSSHIAPPEKIVLAGMPRIDKLHRWRHQHAGSPQQDGPPQVLFFSFSKGEKLRRLADGDADAPTPTWGAFWERTHAAIFDLARDNPDIRVVVKTKGNARQDAATMEALGDRGLPDNLTIVSGGDARELMIQSRVVIGFNTTGLLEAIAIGKPVIVPRFAEACDETLREFIFQLGDAVDYANTPQEIVDKAVTYARTPETIPETLSPAVVQTLDYWIGNSDGQAGRRAYEAIRSEMVTRSGGTGTL